MAGFCGRKGIWRGCQMQCPLLHKISVEDDRENKISGNNMLAPIAVRLEFEITKFNVDDHICIVLEKVPCRWL
jgi:hypothetical protein